MKLRYLFLSVFAFTLILPSSAQIQNDNVVVNTPNAASLVNPNNVVSYDLSKGVVNINVPLTTLKSKKLSIPISISYDGSGIIVDKHPGWVGLNWSLISGGVISRQVEGFPDEVNSQYLPNGGFYFTGNTLQNANWSNVDSLKKDVKIPYSNLIEVPWKSTDPCNYINAHFFDTEPDIFYFNFFGYTGKFFFDVNKQIRVQCEQNIKVEFDSTNFVDNFIFTHSTINSSNTLCSKTFGQFKVTDQYGNIYYFGGPAIEYSDNLLGISYTRWSDCTGPRVTQVPSRGIFSFPSAWYIQKIISADKSDSIIFNYYRGAFISDINTQYVLSTESFVGGGGSCGGSQGGILGSTKIISPVYLSSIDAPNLNVRLTFNASKSVGKTYAKNTYHKIVGYPNIINASYTEDQLADILNITSADINFFGSIPTAPDFDHKLDRLIWPKLDSICIIDTKTNLTNLNIQFNYTDTSTERLKLSSVKFMNNNYSFYQYSFVYNNNKLPDFISVFSDRAGYNNNITLNGVGSWSTINCFGTGQSVTGDNLTNLDLNINNIKQTDSAALLAETLSSIIYPTGGSSKFIFEPHKYSKYVADDRVTLVNKIDKIGGVRIKEIIDSDSVSTAVRDKKFYYVKGYQGQLLDDNINSSGILNYYPKDSIGPYTFTYPDHTETYFHKGSNQESPLKFGDENCGVSYSEVVESESGNGYTIYQFTNFDSGFKDEGMVSSYNSTGIFITPSISKSFLRNKILQKKIFDNSNRLLASEDYSYSSLGDSLNSFVKSVSSYQNVVPYLGSEAAGWATKLYYYTIEPIKIINKQIDLNNITLVDTTTIAYDNDKNAIRKIYRNSKTQTQIEQSEFPRTHLSEQPVYTSMINKNMTAVPIVNSKKISKFQSDTTQIEYDKYNYTYFNSDSVIKISSIEKSFGNNPLIEKIKYERYDSYANLRKYKTEDGMENVIIWDYNNTFPVAVIKDNSAQNNSDTSNAYTTFEADGKGNWNYSGTPSVDNTAPTGKKVYTFNGANPITKSGLSSVTSYIVSYWTKNPSAYSITGTISGYPISGRSVNGWNYYEHKITGQVSITITGTGTIDELRLYPSTAQMATYTYDPIKGMTSACDINNLINYYEYDELGRLQYIRDQDKNYSKRYDYKYQSCPNPFFNIGQSRVYVKCSCGSGFVGSQVTYNIPAEKYISCNNQAEVDQLVNNDFGGNGQTYADIYGSCIACPGGSFSAASGWNNLYQSIIPNSCYVPFTVIMSAQSSSSFNNISTTGVIIGTLGATCSRPVVDKSFSCFESGRLWSVTIYAANGQIRLTRTGGAALPNPGSPFTLTGNYNLY